jgi:hypothetical protein
MSDLIERLQAATCGSRELDGLISMWLQVGELTESMERTAKDWAASGPEWTEQEGSHCVPHFTTSINAALTLVPKGCGWLAQHIDRDAMATIFPPVAENTVAWAKTAPLALCIAALKAREAR